MFPLFQVLKNTAKTLTFKLDLCIQIYVSDTQNDIDYIHID